MPEMRSGGAEMKKIKSAYAKTSDLKVYEANARKHTDADVDAIVESIKTFGFVDPIGVWGKQNIIVEGHGRLMAAERIGMEEVPIIRLDHLDDEQRRAYALAHNMTALLSSWDKVILEMELENIDEIDMEAFGFADPEVRGQDFTEGTELDLDDFADETFDHECPECGFRWSDE